ncbi:MAG: MerR family transcriptional regulator, light-induced transcriptional regulator [Frankiales bacterium]|jgi:DNA-binding transcriptional MerR regulator|nr:MerR family transcriptional regulator, light-induced transcriptional regulator [Frankiales bacterium]
MAGVSPDEPPPTPEPSPDDDQPGPGYTVAAIARRLGMAPATLRTWDRRYGLGPSGHAFGRHRRYTDEDLERLQAMRRLTHEGVSYAEAARLAAGSAQALQSIAPEQVQAQAGGGRILAMPGSSPDVRGLARAAMSLDAAAVTTTIRRSLREVGVCGTWHGLVGPVLHGAGERWEATGRGVEVEHLLAECALAALRSNSPPEPQGPPRVLLAGAPDDYHSLPLHVLAAALAEQRIASRNLGGSVPRDALADAVRRTGPSVLFLWSSLRTTGDPAQLADVPVTAPAVSILVGGAGWWLEDLPPRAAYSTDVPHAVELVEQRLGR